MIGDLIRDLRLARGFSQSDLADQLYRLTDRTIERGKISRWEGGKVVPGREWLSHLAVALDVPLDALRAEARLSSVDRRAFISLAALAATYGKAADEMASSLADRDPGPLVNLQTTHGTDLVIARKVGRDKAMTGQLRRWMLDGDTPVLRVNSAGILAKVPSQSSAETVVRVLRHDEDVRRLYMTAVVARAGSLDWSEAERIAICPAAVRPRQARLLAPRLATETVNGRDAGARWCSAVMLRDLSPLLSGEEGDSGVRI